MKAFTRELIWDLKGNRTNATLSFVALFIAVLSLLATSVLSSIGTDALVARSEQLSGRAITLEVTLADPLGSIGAVRSMSSDLNEWQNHGVWGSLILEYSVGFGGATSSDSRALLRLVSPQYPQIRRISTVSGRWFSPASYPGEVVVNSALAASINMTTGVTQIQLNNKQRRTVTIVGVVADGSTEPAAYTDAAGYMSGANTNPLPDTSKLAVHFDDVSLQGYAKIRVADSLAKVGITATPEIARVDSANQNRDSLATLSLVFFILAAVAMSVAIVGMINVGLSSIRERARDLTIRRAMGATKLRVLGSVTAATIVVGLLATLAAVVVSYVMIWLITPMLATPESGVVAPQYPWSVAFGVAAIGAVASLISGLAPALRTLKFDLASALRE